MIDPFVPIDGRALGLTLENVASEITEASPRTGSRTLASIGDAEVGVWEMTAGVMHDVEVDELFVVIDGEATVTLLDGGEAIRAIELGPGTVCRLSAGMTTRWDVPRLLRKVYILGAPREESAFAERGES